MGIRTSKTCDNMDTESTDQNCTRRDDFPLKDLYTMTISFMSSATFWKELLQKDTLQPFSRVLDEMNNSISRWLTLKAGQPTVFPLQEFLDPDLMLEWVSFSLDKKYSETFENIIVPILRDNNETCKVTSEDDQYYYLQVSRAAYIEYLQKSKNPGDPSMSNYEYFLMAKRILSEFTLRYFKYEKRFNEQQRERKEHEAFLLEQEEANRSEEPVYIELALPVGHYYLIRLTSTMYQVRYRKNGGKGFTKLLMVPKHSILVKYWTNNSISKVDLCKKIDAWMHKRQLGCRTFSTLVFNQILDPQFIIDSIDEMIV